MSDPAYRNFVSQEGDLLGTAVMELESKSRHIMIMNDSNNVDIQFRFTTAEEWGTLKPTESLALNLTEEKIILRSSKSAPYRCWVFG